MIHELIQPIYVNTDLGKGLALFLIDYGINLNTCWVVTILETGEVKHFDSNQIRIERNDTYKINLKDKNGI